MEMPMATPCGKQALVSPYPLGKGSIATLQPDNARDLTQLQEANARLKTLNFAGITQCQRKIISDWEAVDPKSTWL